MMITSETLGIPSEKNIDRRKEAVVSIIDE